MRFLSFLPMLLFAAFLPAQNNCNISGLTATVSDINPTNCQYTVVLNFDHSATTNQFKVQGNGIIYGTFTYNQLPLTLGPFTAGNTPTMREFVVRDVIVENCSDDVVVNIPACSTSAACHIYDVVVTTGDCMTNSNHYNLTLDFEVTAPTNSLFEVWTLNNTYLGIFPISALPVQINNFPASGNDHDNIKICINDNLNCCVYKEFPAPDCNPTPCNIYDVVITTGDCLPNSPNYNLTLDFEVTAPTNSHFEVWAGNTQYLGIFPISALPVQINNFPGSGNIIDLIRICINDNQNCCEYKEFPAPKCDFDPCHIIELVVDPGECHNNGTYQLVVDFGLQSPGDIDSFMVFANGSFFGKYGINQLPLTIPNFPWNGGATDMIKICVANDQTECCRTKEFEVPDCFAGSCEIFNLVVDPGTCTSNTTYQLLVNFQVQSSSDIDSFVVYANGVLFGKYGINQLPLTIPNFPYNGGVHDVIKVCVANTLAECCRIKEFPVPDCLSGPCAINDLVVDPGACTSNTTYQLVVNFSVLAPGIVDSFLVFANGNFFGKFGLNQLPLTIPNFPYNGGTHDVIKICIGNNVTECCRIKEFAVPDCLNTQNCEIYDLRVLHTPCLCGQFFAVLTFKSENGGSGGFDIVGNGHNYGTFPYNHPQPIILGPFQGNGTNYEFAVRDHFHPECHDAVELGEIVCMVPVTDPGNGIHLSLSPNPAGDWLQVAAQMPGGVQAGQSNIEVYSADGRLVIHQTVADGGNFQLNVSALPAGMYRLVVLSGAGRMEGTFAKR